MKRHAHVHAPELPHGAAQPTHGRIWCTCTPELRCSLGAISLPPWVQAVPACLIPLCACVRLGVATVSQHPACPPILPRHGASARPCARKSPPSVPCGALATDPAFALGYQSQVPKASEPLSLPEPWSPSTPLACRPLQAMHQITLGQGAGDGPFDISDLWAASSVQSASQSEAASAQHTLGVWGRACMQQRAGMRGGIPWLVVRQGARSLMRLFASYNTHAHARRGVGTACPACTPATG